MDNDVYDYRLHHPKCKYCKYLKIIEAPPFCYSGDLYTCKAKDKDNVFISLPRIFCDCYKVKEEKL